MSLTRKIIDGLLEKVSTDETPLSHVDEQELEAELAARKKARGSSPKKPGQNPRAKYAGASAAAVKHREGQAAKRAKSVSAKRARQRKAQEKAREEAFRQAKASANASSSARPRSSSRSSTGSYRRTASSGGGQKRRAAPRRGKTNIGDHYKTLNLPPTASLTEAKRAFRKLMRKFHPDLAPDNKKKAATELTMRITAAYKAIEEYHSGK